MHWDLIQRLKFWWDATWFYTIKIKSHRQPSEAHSDDDCINIWGNAFADEAAVQTRRHDLQEFNDLCQTVRNHYQSQLQVIPKLWQYMLDVAYLRLQKEEEDTHPQKDLPIGLARSCGPEVHTTGTDVVHSPLLARIRTYEAWVITRETHPIPSEPHQVVFWASRALFGNI